jgi:integrase
MMKTLKQNQTGMNQKSGQEVAKCNFGKTDVRYWHNVIFKPTYTKDGKTLCIEHWAARIQFRGTRELFNLKTPNRAEAAARAKDIYTMLVGTGWPETLAKFKPEMERKAVSTIGDFLKELRGHWSGKPKTFEDYCQKFRTIVSQIFNIKGGRAKFDYVSGGRKEWVAKIDRIKLADVTPNRVNKWRIDFVRKAGKNPVKQRRARISCNSLMRQAKSLFASELLRHVAMHKPDKLPFEGVAFYKRESMRYHSKVDIEALISDAVHELSTNAQEQLKIFLLATMVGLRRAEIDNLQWEAFRWKEGTIRIETTEHSTPKTSDSAGDVPIDKELAALFRGWHAKATGSFVIEADVEPRTDASYAHYRAQSHFDALIKWLKSKGVTAIKPLHEMRKEFGSQLCAKYGIYAASRALRHADIAITAQHYVDQKERVTFGMGNLLVMPGNVTPMRQSDGATRSAAARGARE